MIRRRWRTPTTSPRTSSTRWPWRGSAFAAASRYSPGASVVLDLVAAGLAKVFEHGAHARLRDLPRRPLLDDDAAAHGLVAASQPRAHRDQGPRRGPRGVGDHRRGVPRGDLLRPPAPPHAPPRDEGAPGGVSERERAVGSRSAWSSDSLHGPPPSGWWSSSSSSSPCSCRASSPSRSRRRSASAPTTRSTRATTACPAPRRRRTWRVPLPSSPAPLTASASRPPGACRPPIASRCSTSTPRASSGRRPASATRCGRAATSPIPTSVATAIDEVVAECGGIDVCISNAGIAAAGALRHLDPDVLAAHGERQPHGQLARDPRVPAARRRAPRLRARRRLAGRDRRAAGHRRLRRLQGRRSSSCSTSCASRSATSASTSAWPTSPGSTPTWCAAPSASHPGFAAMRKGLRGPAGKTLPVGDAADAIVRGVQRRSRRVVAPGVRRRPVPPAGPAPRADRSRGGQVRRRTSTASPPRWWPSAAPSPPACARISGPARPLPAPPGAEKPPSRRTRTNVERYQAAP